MGDKKPASKDAKKTDSKKTTSKTPQVKDLSPKKDPKGGTSRFPNR